MGKHDAVPDGIINESLERHYQNEIKRLEANVETLQEMLNEAKLERERLAFKVRLKDIEIESLVKSLAEGGEM